MSEDLVIGIDLGTTNTLAYYLKKGKPTAIRFKGNIMLPSVICVDEDKKILVGKEAQIEGKKHPENMIRSSKTHMGSVKKLWTCNGLSFTPTDVATEVLKTVKAAVVKKLKAEPDATVKAVITVPAYFHSDQIRETKTAGERAGFEVLRIITEPMAAALAAAKIMELNEKVFVVDLGGGTFDLSALEARQSDHSYRTIDTAGDAKLGGDDFDECVYQELAAILLDDIGVDLSNNGKKCNLVREDYNRVVADLHEAAANAKVELSDETSTPITIPYLLMDDGHGNPYTFDYELTREHFYDICQPLFEKISDSVKDFITNSKRFKKNEISKIILAGGSCNIPKIREDVEAFMGMKANTELPLDTLVAIGACFVANHEVNGLDDDETIEDILSHALGVEALDGMTGNLGFSTILDAGAALPATASRDYTTSVDNQTDILANIYEEVAEDAHDDLTKQHYLGFVSLDDIPPQKAGKPNIRVTFQYDVNHILTAEAEDLDTHKKKTITIDKQADEAPNPQEMEQPIDFVLLLDVSWSMNNGNRFSEAMDACRALVDEMIDFKLHRMAFITFSNFAYVIASMTHSQVALRRALDDLGRPDGGTDMARAFREAKQVFDESSVGRERICIMVTDGDPNNEVPTYSMAETLRKSGIRIVAIGAGNGIRRDVLKTIASPGDDYAIDNMSELKETFRKAVEHIRERKTH